MREIRKINEHSGQALLIVLLSMTVILTVVLSVVSRSVTDITITSYGEDAQRAFDAAEAGIEDFLLTGYSSGTPVSIGDASYEVVSANPLVGNAFKYPVGLLSGETATFWFVSHDPDGSLSCSPECVRANRIDKICWGKDAIVGQGDTPAIEMTFYYDSAQQAVFDGNLSGLNLTRVAFDPNTIDRTPANNFFKANISDCEIGGETYDFGFENLFLNDNADNDPENIDIPCWNTAGCLLMVKVKMFYNSLVSQPIAIEVGTTGGTDLPPQGTEIDSEGVAGDSTRRVNVFQSFPEPPFVFDSAIFSQGTITK